MLKRAITALLVAATALTPLTVQAGLPPPPPPPGSSPEQVAEHLELLGLIPSAPQQTSNPSTIQAPPLANDYESRFFDNQWQLPPASISIPN